MNFPPELSLRRPLQIVKRGSRSMCEISELLKSSFGHPSHQTLLLSSVGRPPVACVRVKCCIFVWPSFACSNVRTPIETCWWPFRSKCHLNSLKPVKGFLPSIEHQQRTGPRKKKYGNRIRWCVCAQVHTEPKADKRTQSISESQSVAIIFCLNTTSRFECKTCINWPIGRINSIPFFPLSTFRFMFRVQCIHRHC